MKLYTEEQVIDILQSGSFPYNDEELDEILSELTPIELPSYEEIETKIENMEPISLEIEVGYRAGAKWMRDKIIKQNK